MKQPSLDDDTVFEDAPPDERTATVSAECTDGLCGDVNDQSSVFEDEEKTEGSVNDEDEEVDRVEETFSKFTTFVELDLDPNQIGPAIHKLNETNEESANSEGILSLYGVSRYVRPPGNPSGGEAPTCGSKLEPGGHTDNVIKKNAEASVTPPLPNFMGKVVFRTMADLEVEVNRKHQVECFEDQLRHGRYLNIPRASMWTRCNGGYCSSSEPHRGQGAFFVMRQSNLRQAKGLRSIVIEKMCWEAAQIVRRAEGQCLSYEVLSSCDVDRFNEIWEWSSWISEEAYLSYHEEQDERKQGVDLGDRDISTRTKTSSSKKSTTTTNMKHFDIDAVCDRPAKVSFWERNESGSYFIPESWRGQTEVDNSS